MQRKRWKSEGRSLLQFSLLSTPRSRSVGWACLLMLALVGCRGSTTRTSVAQQACVNANDVVRFLQQATFGSTQADIAHLQEVGYNQYLAEQFAMAPSGYPVVCFAPGFPDDLTGCEEFQLPAVPSNRPENCTGTCQRDNYSLYPLQKLFFQYAFGASDQLRQRVVFALDQILVTSGNHPDLNYSNRMTGYLNMLETYAFGNFRDLLYQLSLNPAMGRYLDSIDNNAAAGINENYGRELMQLFSIGLFELNDDGTQMLDADNNPIPTYDQAGVVELSRALSGWILETQYGAGIPNYTDALRVGAANRHDNGQKTLFGQVLPAGQGAAADLTQLTDIIFNHHNVGPFIGKNLIQHLVTSNPSREYVSRVTQVFNDNGSGVRGDMQAVITAILMDPEARDAAPGPDEGKLLEPVLAITNLFRALGGTTDYALFESALPSNRRMDENVFYSPTVFNFYPPDFPLPQSSTLLGPEFAIQSTNTALARMNLIENLIYQGLPGNTSFIDTSALEAAPDDATMVDTANQLLLGGSMSDAMTQIVLHQISDAPSQLVKARETIYLVATSPNYQVQR